MLSCSCLATGLWNWESLLHLCLRFSPLQAQESLALNAWFWSCSDLYKSLSQRDTSTRSFAERPVGFWRGNPGSAAGSSGQPGHDREDSYWRSSMAGWGSLNTTDVNFWGVWTENHEDKVALGCIQSYFVFLIFADTNFVLANYKTEQCTKPPRLCRQGYACPHYHNSRDRRRNPRKFKYR